MEEDAGHKIKDREEIHIDEQYHKRRHWNLLPRTKMEPWLHDSLGRNIQRGVIRIGEII